MRLFGYYALHSFVNQLKKLFKTWVLIFIVVCMLIGGLIGFGAATLSNMAEEQEGIEEIEPGEIDPGEELPIEVPEEIDEGENDRPEWLSAAAIVELVAGGVVLALLAFEALSADKNGSAIFLPADVNLLFPSPMKPQSVLMFRLATQLGVALVSGIYMLFQLPNLTLNAGLSIWAALALVAAYCLMIMFGKLLQLLLYMLGSTYPRVKPAIRPVTYALLGLIGLGYFAYWRAGDMGPLEAAVKFFTAPATRLIPIWGWLKGFCAYACEGSAVGCAWTAAVMVAAIALMVFVIGKIRADFYEDAMARSEETAALLAEAQEKGYAFRKKKKDRSESLRRDSMNHGWGASVFFFKTMYNRFRFAKFGVLTKTSGTYFVAAVGLALLLRFVIGYESIVPVVLALGVVAFYRSLGNPLASDTKMEYFRAIPESPWKKIFFSLLGGSASCLLDLLPGMLAAMVILRASPLSVLAWMLFIVSVDFYSTNVGVFIDLSVPVSAGKMVKQFVQILFIYFGLLPDIGIIAFAMVKDRTVTGTVAAAAFNVLVGLLFFTVSPLFLEPGSRRVSAVVLSDEELKKARHDFSLAGLALFLMLGLATALQLVLVYGLKDSPLLENPYVPWLVTFAPLYLVAVPAGLLLLRKLPAHRPEERALGAKRFASDAVIGVFLMYAGNLASVLVLSLIGLLIHSQSANPLDGIIASDMLLLRILVPVIIAPLVEEYIFRRQLIDRLGIYGGKLAVVISALAFGLFHGNLFQFFYAFTLGLLFGYIYLHTGRLRYSVALHMLINFFGTIVGPWVLERADLENLDMDAIAAGTQSLTGAQTGFVLYILAVLLLAAAGFVLLFVNARRIDYAPAEREIQRGKRFQTSYLNVGMLLLTLAALALTVYSTI